MDVGSKGARYGLGAVAALGFALLLDPARGFATNVTTYHYDNLRTGWDQSETVLTPASVASSSFGLLHQVTLDEQVDGQPLFVSGQTMAGATRNVVYVATEANSIYAIDADSGAVLLRRNLGTPVPISALPGGCNNNSNNMGINSTPVIDMATRTMYVTTYTYEDGAQTFRIHALSLGTLADTVPSAIVSASAKLTDGSTYNFNPVSSRQRAALIETSGNVYAGFASFCDFNGNVSRGWVLGWQAGTLAPLPANTLLNQASTAVSSFFLTSVWMSGYGIASDDRGSLFFVTGNSDTGTYDPKTNIAESVVKLSADLTTVQGYFTPGNHVQLDSGDVDFGSGGALLLPDVAGAYPHLAVAAGKGNSLYLLNRDNLGGEGAKPPALRTYANPGCWCGQTYYGGPDGVGRVVTSLGQNVAVWKVKTQPAPSLVVESTGPTLSSGQDGGFFTTVSSNGTAANTAVIWALPHPDNSDSAHTIVLTAFDPANGAKQIYSAAAGSWPFYGNANANLVPVVGNGHVFVASYRQLSIFGLAAPARHVAFAAPPAAETLVYTGTRHQVYGRVMSTRPGAMTLRRRDGTLVSVRLTAAEAAPDITKIAAGRAALVRGDYDGAGVLVARFVLHAKDAPQLWGADR